jgi:DNA-binding MarR family transcriptional regulator
MSDIFDYFRRVADKPDDWSSEELSGADIKFILGEIERLRAANAAMLAALDEFGPSSQADLGRCTGIDRSDVVAAINAMVERGFVERSPDPSNGRRNIVTITAAGKHLRSVMPMVASCFLSRGPATTDPAPLAQHRFEYANNGIRTEGSIECRVRPPCRWWHHAF